VDFETLEDLPDNTVSIYFPFDCIGSSAFELWGETRPDCKMDEFGQSGVVFTFRFPGPFDWGPDYHSRRTELPTLDHGFANANGKASSRATIQLREPRNLMVDTCA
jgi:hypothetical protein